MTVEQIARVCHEANKGYCESIGDMSQKSWQEAEQWQKDSAIAGVQYRMHNPGAPPSAQHESWKKAKEEAGWVYGEVKDPEKKIHPCMVPYDQLPKDQRLKDALFQAAVDSLNPVRDVVTLAFSDYADLKKNAAWLGCLEQAGVDNWDGYGIAADQFAKEFPEYQN
jgi:hypothetical protein